MTLAGAAVAGALALGPNLARADGEPAGAGCQYIADQVEGTLYHALKRALTDAAQVTTTGLDNDMWGTIVDRFGIVCAVAHTGRRPTGDQWLGSRVISAQKANTGNAFSLSKGLALSSANLYGLAQPGGSLFGLQFSNPVDPAVAYGDNAVPPDQGHDSTDAPAYGDPFDPLVGKYIGGINVFGGGFALYDKNGKLIGGLGVSGDTSCADHVIGWITRFNLNLDNVPAGVGAGNTDNIIFDLEGDGPVGFEHPLCGFGEETVAETLPADFPVGP